MQYLVIAYDYKDPNAAERRTAVREQHLKLGRSMHGEGKAIIGGAILDETGKMIGSARVVEFESPAELDEWLAREPYCANRVWESIQILPFRISETYKAGKKVQSAE